MSYVLEENIELKLNALELGMLTACMYMAPNLKDSTVLLKINIEATKLYLAVPGLEKKAKADVRKLEKELVKRKKQTAIIEPLLT